MDEENDCDLWAGILFVNFRENGDMIFFFLKSKVLWLISYPVF